MYSYATRSNHHRPQKHLRPDETGKKIYCTFHKLVLCHAFELKIKSDHHIQEVTAAHQLRLKSHLDHGEIKHLLDREELVIPQGSASVLCLPAWYT